MDILLAVGRGLQALLLCVAVAAQGACIHLAVHDLGNAPTEQFALVVASSEASPPVQWHRDEEVDVVETAGGQQFEAHLAPHEEAEVGVAVEFHGMDGFLHGVAVAENENGCHDR